MQSALVKAQIFVYHFWKAQSDNGGEVTKKDTH